MLLILFACALSAGASTGPILDPQWIPLPALEVERLKKAYPSAASERGIDGEATVECRVTNSGSLADCRVLEETPEGEGFGQAAAKVAESFRMKGVALSGAPTEGRIVRLPIQFRTPWSPDDATGERPAFTVRLSPRWAAKPTGYDIARVYPDAAQRMLVNGSATIRCRVEADGRMSGCLVVTEAPAGFHFGDAVLKLAPLFRIDLKKDNPSVGREISIPVQMFVSP